jgi:hypothetical protein
MAALSDDDRKEVWAELMRSLDCPGAITKTDLRAAVDAADAWVDANAASFNAALPQPARGGLTNRQKSALLTYVVQRRYGVAV